MAAPGAAAGASPCAAAELSLLPLKPGDHLWRPLPGGAGTWHALYVGQFALVPQPGGDAALAIAGAPGAAGLPQCVVAVAPAPGAAAAGPGAGGAGAASAGAGAGAAGCVSRIPLAEFAGRTGDDDGACVRLYTRRPRGRKDAVERALRALGMPVDGAAAAAFPELLPWWAIFDEAAALQPGLCATRAKALRYRLSPLGDAPVQPALMGAVLAGGAVVSRGRVVLRGVRLMKVLRLTKAASAGWANLGSFVGGQIAAGMLDDGDATTAAATAAGGWAGGLAGASGAAAVASAVGVEGLGAGSVLGGLVAVSSLGFAGAVAGAGLAYGAKKAMDRRPLAEVDRSAAYYDCGLRLIGDADDVFNLFGATLEFPPEDAEIDCGADGGGAEDVAAGVQAAQGPDGVAPCGERLAAAGWYAVRVRAGLGA